MSDICNECDDECVSKGLCEHDEMCLADESDRKEMQNLIERIRIRERYELIAKRCDRTPQN